MLQKSYEVALRSFVNLALWFKSFKHVETNLNVRDIHKISYITFCQNIASVKEALR